MFKYIPITSSIIACLIALYIKNINILIWLFPIFIIVTIIIYQNIIKNPLLNKKSAKILRFQMFLQVILITIPFIILIVLKYFSYPKVSYETISLIYSLVIISYLYLAIGYFILSFLKRHHHRELQNNK